MYILSTLPKINKSQLRNINTYIFDRGSTIIAFRYKHHAEYVLGKNKYNMHVCTIPKNDLFDYCDFNNHTEIEVITNVLCEIKTKKEIYHSEIAPLSPTSSVDAYFEKPWFLRRTSYKTVKVPWIGHVNVFYIIISMYVMGCY